MSFRISGEGVDAAAVMADIRRVIEEKKRAGLLTDEEVREIAEHPLHPVLQAHDLALSLLGELLESKSRWNYAFDTETVYRSSRGGVGQALEAVRRWLRPVQKLFWNPNPMISALSRQSEINAAYAQLVHNLVLEVTRLNLEVQDLKQRALSAEARMDDQARRHKTLESLALRGPGDEPSP